MAAMIDSAAPIAHAPRRDSLRVLWVTTSLSWDGPGRALAAILRHWPDARDAVRVVALREIAPAFRAAIPGDVETHAIGMRGIADARAITALVSHCRTWRPDILHTQLSRADWIGRPVGALLRLPVVSTIQNVHSRMYAAEFSTVTRGVGRALDRLTNRMASHLIAVSAGVGADLRRAGVPPDRISVIYNPFDLSREAASGARDAARRMFGCDDDDVVVGTVALLKPQKGVRDLVAAAAEVYARDRRVRFVHAGGGPLEREVRQWIDQAGLAERFRLLGWVDDPLTVLPGMDVFALPSHWEGLPIALLEAMAAGLPAVGTRVPGIEEVIVPGETGLLVPPGEPEALARAILELTASPDMRRRLGAAARGRLQAFDARTIAAETRRVYLDVLARAAR